MAARTMTADELNKLTDDVANMIEQAGCEYLFAIFPPIDGVVSSDADTASIGMNIEDAEVVARFLSRLIMQGGELGWRLLLILQKTCREFPVPLMQVLAASQADYQYMTGLQVFKSAGEKETVARAGIASVSPAVHQKVKTKK